jgi:hypothetical protein
MIRAALSAMILIVLCLSSTAFGQTKADEERALALYASYQKYIAQKNWIMANNFGNAILKKYPGSEVARKVKVELPDISKRAEAAYKDQQVTQAQNRDKQKQDEAAKKKSEAAQRALEKKALAGLRKQRDQVEGITFYYAPTTDTGVANQWYLYMGVPDGDRPYLRFKWMYTADTWLFVRNITLNIDGNKTPTAPLGHFSVKRDNSGSRIWEWQDSAIREADIPFFKRLAASKKAIIRYEGDKYYQDRTLSQAEKKAFMQVLTAYEGLRRAGK